MPQSTSHFTKNALKHVFNRRCFSGFNFFVTALYGFVRLPRLSYSQHGEDLILASMFPRGYKGKYIDVGGFHPKWISNTHILHRIGWSGIVLDLEEDKLSLFTLARGQRVRTICAALVPGEQIGKIEFSKFRGSLSWSMVDTISESHSRRASEKLGSTPIFKLVDSIGVNTLLVNESPIDLLDLDIEGIDEAVVCSIDFKACDIGIIMFEANSTPGGELRTRKLLESNGFTHLFTAGPTNAYISHSYMQRFVKHD